MTKIINQGNESKKKTQETHRCRVTHAYKHISAKKAPN